MRLVLLASCVAFVGVAMHDDVAACDQECGPTCHWMCTICGYVYVPAEGDPDNGIDPGTPFADLPDDWVCPVCGCGKDCFQISDWCSAFCCDVNPCSEWCGKSFQCAAGCEGIPAGCCEDPGCCVNDCDVWNEHFPNDVCGSEIECVSGQAEPVCSCTLCWGIPEYNWLTSPVCYGICGEPLLPMGYSYDPGGTDANEETTGFSEDTCFPEDNGGETASPRQVMDETTAVSEDPGPSEGDGGGATVSCSGAKTGAKKREAGDASVGVVCAELPGE